MTGEDMKMKRQHGFGLLEILITMVVLGVAVVGLVAFSKSALMASQDGRRYEIAMRFAESKIDELRNFNASVSATAPLIAYNPISSNLTGTTLTQSGDDYKVTWSVTDKYWNNVTSVWQNTPPSGYTASTPGQKTIMVTVSWKNSENQDKNLQLSSNISPSSSLLKNQLDGGLDSSRTGPKIAFNPGAVPDVVSTDLDSGGVNKKEASKPLPDVSKSGSSLRVKFDTTTYQATGGASTQQALQDFATVSCSCKYESNVGKADSYLPALPFYIESNKVQYWKVGKKTNKLIGMPSDKVKDEDELCTSSTTNCCRDHYDVTTEGFAGYYDPLNLQRAVSGYYQDACRFVRIDGVYRPAPDWHLIALTTFPSNFLDDAANLAAYQKYIVYAVVTYTKWQKQTFSTMSDSSWSSISTSPPNIEPFMAWSGRGNVSTNLSTDVSKTLQLISRGIYVDIMPPSYLNNEVFKNNTDEPDLAKIPFQDVNMTLLSTWRSSDDSKGTVSNGIIKDYDPDLGYYKNSYSRGLLTTVNPTNTPITITASSFQGNSGVVGETVPQGDITNAISSTIQVSIKEQTAQTETEYRWVIECQKLKTTGNTNNPKNEALDCDTSGLTIDVSNSAVRCEQVTIRGNSATIVYTCRGVPGSQFYLTFQKTGYDITPSRVPLSETVPSMITLPDSGITNGGCVKMVESVLFTVIPAPTPVPSKTCSTPVP